jgi:hypothetical protein
MSTLLTWARKNPIVTGSMFLAVISLVGLFIVGYKKRGFLASVEKRSNDLIYRIDGMKRTPVTIPPDAPDQPPQSRLISINPKAIDELARVYNLMDKEYSNISGLVRSINQANHYLMVENLFKSSNDASIPFAAKDTYQKALKYMLGIGTEIPDQTYPQVKTGSPPTQESIIRELDDLQETYLSGFFPVRKAEELIDFEAESLNKKKTDKLIEMLQQQAQSIHLYAQTRTFTSEQFPLDLGEWSMRSEQPKPEAVWEGQMGLWIQQDIIQAIAIANRVDDPESNVTTAPVKRLIKVRIVPGYVGIDTRGGLDPTTMAAGARALVYTRSDDSDQPQSEAPVGTEKLLEDFSTSPTGRISNPLYDVRHVILSVVVDSEKLSVLFDCLQQINLMSILKIDLKNVDEYAALREGYFYGVGDVVQADILIETVWLRDWTTQYMPNRVAEHLGIVQNKS